MTSGHYDWALDTGLTYQREWAGAPAWVVGWQPGWAHSFTHVITIHTFKNWSLAQSLAQHYSEFCKHVHMYMS